MKIFLNTIRLLRVPFLGVSAGFPADRGTAARRFAVAVKAAEALASCLLRKFVPEPSAGLLGCCAHSPAEYAG